jgi:hypothetical protein
MDADQMKLVLSEEPLAAIQLPLAIVFLWRLHRILD